MLSEIAVNKQTENVLGQELLPNIAVIRWTEDSFLQVMLDGSWSCREFTTMADDTYNKMRYDRIKFCHHDGNANGVLELRSLSVQNRDFDNVVLRDDPERFKVIVREILKAEYDMTIEDFVRVLM